METINFENQRPEVLPTSACCRSCPHETWWARLSVYVSVEERGWGGGGGGDTSRSGVLQPEMLIQAGSLTVFKTKTLSPSARFRLMPVWTAGSGTKQSKNDGIVSSSQQSGSSLSSPQFSAAVVPSFSALAWHEGKTKVWTGRRTTETMGQRFLTKVVTAAYHF